MNLVKTSYSHDDVVLLLKDLTDCMKPIDVEERERLIQSGVHYSEMLPMEREPSEEYMRVYEESLDKLSAKTAVAVRELSEKLWMRHKGPFVIASLARAGLPIGILIKRYIKMRYHVDLPHFGISIIRDRGIDINAMNYIYEHGGEQYGVRHIQFIDGWVGKGAITRILVKACNELRETNPERWGELDPTLGVVADPCNTKSIYGTNEDFLIPSACLNSTVSGLVSRTILNSFIGPDDFHGAVYFEQFTNCDHSYEFIERVEKHFNNKDIKLKSCISCADGMDKVRVIQDFYGIPDINKVKPSVGETTRVLLRRVPWKVIINPVVDKSEIAHIYKLCEDKHVPIEYADLGNYMACGLIKDLHGDI